MDRAKLARVVGLCGLFFAVIYWRYGVKVSVVSLTCFACGYANEFYVFRSVLSLLGGQAIGVKVALVSACGLAADVFMIYFGVSIGLAIGTAIFFVVDAAVLRFR